MVSSAQYVIDLQEYIVGVSVGRAAAEATVRSFTDNMQNIK